MERVILVSATLKSQPQNEKTLQELRRLAHTAGAEVVYMYRVRVEAFNAATLIGKGKLQEIALQTTTLKADGVIFDDEISPAQQNNLEEILPNHFILVKWFKSLAKPEALFPHNLSLNILFSGFSTDLNSLIECILR